MNKAISYVRYSSKEQENGDSYRRQVEAAEEYCLQHNLELDRTILDAGVSAFKGSNAKVGALSRIMDDVDAGLIPRGTTLIIESLDRLSRMEVEKALQLLLEIVNDKDLIVVTLVDEKVYRKGQLDIMTLMMSLVTMARANEESLMKSRRLSAVWAKKQEDARQGKILSPRIPSWLNLIDGEFVINEEKAERVRTAFDILASGKGVAATISRLNQAGISAPTGAKWSPSSLKNLIYTQAVIGHYQPHTSIGGKREPTGELINNYYPAIVDEKIYWTVRYKISSNKGSNAERNGKVGNLFSGLINCRRCGAVMRYFNKGKRPKGNRYLACRARTEGHGCDLPYIQYQHVEIVFFHWLTMCENVRILAPEKPKVDKALVTAKLEENAQKQATLFDLMDQNGLSDAMKERFTLLSNEEKELKQMLEGANEDIDFKLELSRLVTYLKDSERRADVARQIRRLGIKISIDDRLIDIEGKTIFRGYQKGNETEWVDESGEFFISVFPSYSNRET